MRNRVLGILLIVVCAPSLYASPLVIRDIAVVPMTAEVVVRHQTVIVDEGRVQVIGPAARVAIPEGAQVIDGHGRYLMPGIADMHVHLTSTEELPVYLSYGVTTVLNMRGAPEDLRWREQVAAGRLIGPRIYTVGPTTDGDPPRNRRFISLANGEDARGAVRQQKREGYDAIKVYDKYQPATHAAVLAEAAQQGLAVFGHIPKAVGAERALALGQANIAHGEELYFTWFEGKPDAARIAPLVQLLTHSGATVTMNMAAKQSTVRQLDGLESMLQSADGSTLTSIAYHQWMRTNNPYVNRPNLAQFRQNNLVMYAFLLKLAAAFDEASIPMLVGSDASWAGEYPGQAAHREVAAFVEAGLSPYRALRHATAEAGQFARRALHENETFGVIEKGARADLLLLRTNPLLSLAALDGIDAVIANGRLMGHDDLAAMVRTASIAHKAERELVDRFDLAVSRGDLDSARSAFEAMGTRRLLDLNVLIFDILAASEKNADLAVWLGEVATRLYPEEFASWNALGGACEKASRPSCAQESFARSVAIQPFNAVGKAGIAATGHHGD